MKKVVILLSTLTAVLLSAGRAPACGCISPPLDTEEAFRTKVAADLEGADAVFSGEVVAEDPFRVKFKVRRVWKGDAGDELTLLTGTVMTEDGLYLSSRCEYHFTQGASYLVFAAGAEDNLKAAHCSLTGVLSRAERVAGELDRLTGGETVPAGGAPPIEVGWSYSSAKSARKEFPVIAGRPPIYRPLTGFESRVRLTSLLDAGAPRGGLLPRLTTAP